MNEQETTVYDLVGGAPFFVGLVDRFYTAVEQDPLLIPMYHGDLTESRRTLTGFLIQYWGGPDDYSVERGHPRLRMRHNPFVIGPAERDAWVRHMVASLEASDAHPEIEDAMRGYFEQAATAMINAPLKVE